MAKLDSVPKIFFFADRKALRAWFEKNYDQTEAFWLVYEKAAGGKRTLSYTDIVQECLCFGFIDSLPRRVSDTPSSLYISRRKPKSEWSKINKAHVAELIRKKLLHPAGLALVKKAKADGSWNKINASENYEEPADFTAALKKRPKQRKHVDSLSPSIRKAFLHRLHSAKTSVTRAKRLDFLLKLLEVEMKPSEFRLAFTKGVIPQR